MVTFISTDLEEQFMKTPHNVTRQLNGSNIDVKIPCNPPIGYPLATASWRQRFRNGTIIVVQESDRIAIRERWLKIKNVQELDTGFYQYQCIANNGYYERTSDFIFLNIRPSE